MKKTRREIQSFTKLIADYCKPEKIILFGSFARGDFKDTSDVDLLIIKKSNKKRPFRVKEVFEALRGTKRSFSLDPLVYTPQEIKQRLSLGDFFVKRILTEGKTLYG